MNTSPLVGNSYHGSSSLSGLLGCAGCFSGVQLCDPVTVARRAPPAMGFPRRGCWSGLPCPLPGDLSDPRTELSWVPYHLSHQGSPPNSAPFLDFSSEFLMYFFHCHLRNLTSPLGFITSWRILMGFILCLLGWATVLVIQSNTCLGIPCRRD